ncbi:unnamed protein product, partial [Discosporangium mesarthrocarpum]
GTEADVLRITGEGTGWGGFKIRILTQNLWAVPIVSQCMEARVHAFLRTLGSWDIMALQEVWHGRERDAIRRAAQNSGLRYCRHFQLGYGLPLLGLGSGGTGLMILSRYPITETLFQRFLVNGHPCHLKHPKYRHCLGVNGVGLARVCTPAGSVDVYVTHLHGPCTRGSGSGTGSGLGLGLGDGEGSSVRHKAHQVAQSFQLSHFINTTRKSPLVVLLADLSAGPQSLPYALQRSMSGMIDAFHEVQPLDAGYTFGAKENIFRKRRSPPARVDYVFYKTLPPPLCHPQRIEPHWELRTSWVQQTLVPDSDVQGLLGEGPRLRLGVERGGAAGVQGLGAEAEASQASRGRG